MDPEFTSTIHVFEIAHRTVFYLIWLIVKAPKQGRQCTKAKTVTFVFTEKEVNEVKWSEAHYWLVAMDSLVPNF